MSNPPFIVGLVVSIIFYFLFHIWDVILPIDELIFFKMVIAPPTSSVFTKCCPGFRNFSHDGGFPTTIGTFFLHSLWICNLWNNHRNMMKYGITIDYKVIPQCRICSVFQLQYALFVNTKGKIVCNWGMIFMMFNSVIQMLPTSHAEAAKEFYSQNTSPHCVLYPHDISPILVGWQAPQSSE